MKNLDIKLPEQLYCGFDQRGPDELLAFITPFGSDSAFLKRKSTVDHWSNSNRSKEKIEPKILDNELLDGYRIDRHIKRYGWNSSNVVVRVEDPRGFEAEISVANLCKILENNTIENGLIKNRCIWGRDGSQNILLAENSQPYLDAIQNTARQKKTVSVKDVRPGNTILLKNGKTVLYLGKGYDVNFSETDSPHQAKEFYISYDLKRAKHLYSTIDEKGLVCIQSTSELKISEILDPWEYESDQDRRDAITRLNRLSLCHGKAFIFDKDQKISFSLEKAENFDSYSRSILGYSVIRNRMTGTDTLLNSFYFRYLESYAGRDMKFSQLGHATITPKKITCHGDWKTSSGFGYLSSYKVRHYFDYEKEDLPKTINELLEGYDLFRITYTID